MIGKDLGRLKISSTTDGIFLIDCLIDFTTPEASEGNFDYVAKYRKSLVLGTTGLNEGQLQNWRRSPR